MRLFRQRLKFGFLLVFLLSVITLVGCEKVEPSPEIIVETDKSAEVIDAIDALPDEITKASIKDVSSAERLYKALSEEDKAKVTNYEKLAKAIADKNYLQDLDYILMDEFDKVEAFLNENIPLVLESDVDTIEFVDKYNYVDERQTIIYRITYTFSDTEIINGLGEVKHGLTDTYIDVRINVKCSYNNVERVYEKKIKVERNLDIMFDHSILVAYWYGRFQELTKVDYESIDIINYSFAQIAQDEAGKWYIDGRLNRLSSFAPAKEKGIKICLSLGGWHDDSSFWDIYAKAAKTEESRIAVANAILDVIKEYNLDGIDMDWEYPKSTDKTNFTLLMKQIRDTLKAYNKDLLVTAAIPAGDWITSRFDLAKLNDILDYFYIMTYDLDDGMNCNHLSSLSDAKDSVSFFIKNKVAKEKLVIGSAFYGRIYEGVSDNGKGGLGERASSKDETSFDNIKENYLSRLGKGVTKYYDEEAEAYYLYDSENNQFITYEDTESVTDKWNYVIDSGIGGLMYWSYENDKSNTLMTAINAAQKNNK